MTSVSQVNMSRKDSNAQCDLWSGVSIRLLLKHAVLNTQPILTYIFKLSILTTPKIVYFTLPPRVGSRKECTSLWGSRVGVEGIVWILLSMWAAKESLPQRMTKICSLHRLLSNTTSIRVLSIWESPSPTHLGETEMSAREWGVDWWWG